MPPLPSLKPVSYDVGTGRPHRTSITCAAFIIAPGLRRGRRPFASRRICVVTAGALKVIDAGPSRLIYRSAKGTS